METAIVIAKIWALYFTIIGVWFLIKGDALLSLVKKLFNSEEYAFLQGLITLGLGIVVVVNYSYWTFDWRLMITFIHWLIFAKGIYIFFFPGYALQLTNSIINRSYIKSIALLHLFFAIYFIYFGFVNSML